MQSLDGSLSFFLIQRGLLLGCGFAVIMTIFLIPFLALFLIGLRPFRHKNGSDYLSRDITLRISGLFAVIIFFSHFFSYIDTSTFTLLDSPAFVLVGFLGQLMVAPFLFFSGYGLFEQYKKRGQDYVRGLPRNRILKVWLSFLVAWLLFAVTALALKSPYTLPDYFLSLFGFVAIGNSNWYVVVILLLYLLTFVALSFAQNQKMAVGLITLFSLTLYLFLRQIGQPSFWYNTIIAYPLGALYSFCRPRVDRFLFQRKPTRFLAFGCSLLVFAAAFFLQKYVASPFIDEIAYALEVCSFCFGIVFFLTLLSPKSRVLRWMGGVCFWIYILQRLPMIWFSQVPPVANSKYLYLVICAFVTMSLAFVASKAFNYLYKLFSSEGKTGESTNVKVGIGISYLGLGISLIAAFVVTPRVLEALGDAQYGLYAFANSITSWLTVISSALGASYLRFATKEKTENGSEKRVNTSYAFLFASFASVLFLLLALGIIIFYFAGFRLPQYTEAENALVYLLLLISGINVAVTILFSVFGNYCNYKKRFIFLRTVSLFVTIGSFAGNLIASLLTRSVVWVAAVAVMVTALSNLAIAFYAIRKQQMQFAKPNIKSDSKLIKSIFIFSSFVLLNAVVDQVNQNLDKTLLGIMVNAESVTLYTLAKYFNSYLLTLSVSISGSFAPKVHELVASKDKKGLADLFIKVSKIQLFVLLLFAGGFAACGAEFIKLWLGEAKEVVYFYVLVPICLDVVSLSCNLGIEVQRAMNKHKFRAFLYLGLAILNVGLTVLFIKVMPVEHAALAALLGTAVAVILGNWTLLNIYNWKVIGLPIPAYFRIVLRDGLLTGVALTPSVLLRLFLFPSDFSLPIQMILEGFLFLLIFIPLMALCEKEAFKSIWAKIRKLVKQ